MTQPLTGLFLGAGASCELGMPLVWNLTAELKALLPPAKLRQVNKEWRVYGEGVSDTLIEETCTLLENENLHYESILGYLETQFRRNGKHRQEYHQLYVRLVNMLYHILYFRHLKKAFLFDPMLCVLKGIVSLANANAPLWIFSLNHDLVIECLAAKYGLPICSGFYEERIALPRRNEKGEIIGELVGEVITHEQLEKKGMLFLRHGTYGINLLKIHGALDVFVFRDGKDVLKLLPAENSVRGVLECLRQANEELLFLENGEKVQCTNEITYADDAGVMQFLRRSLLAGAYKFNDKATQVLPMRFLDYFKSNLNYLTTLICVGYSFGDDHVNKVIKEWLQFSDKRQLIIVDPNIKNTPSFLLHLTPQIQCIAETASAYLSKG